MEEFRNCWRAFFGESKFNVATFIQEKRLRPDGAGMLKNLARKGKFEKNIFTQDAN